MEEKPHKDSDSEFKRRLAEGRRALERSAWFLQPGSNSEKAREISPEPSASNDQMSQPKRPRLPTPIMPLRGFASRKKPKPTAPLDHLPPGYPACLAPQTDLIICKAVKKYPVQIQTQVVDLCKYVVTELRPHFRRATSEKLVRQDMALHEMNALLDYLLVENWDSDSRRYELKIEITRSNEWLRLVRDIANIPPAALTRPCESRDGTARKPKLWTETQRALAAVLVSQFDQLPENKKKQGKRQFVMKKAAEYVVKSKDGSKKPINPESLWRNYYEQTKCL